ncbi:MAG: dihydropteroate synthase [Actinobacteria bacterium]|nr:dihydropteroate synthase [Actinomycetota bacterium]
MGYKIRKLNLKTKKQGLEEFDKIGASLPGQLIMINKIFPLALKVKDVDVRAANILKQEMLSRGGDVVTSRQSLVRSEGAANIIILGTEKAIFSLIDKIKMQPFGLKKLSEQLAEYVDLLEAINNRKIIKMGGIDFQMDQEGALIMGILNITPDSFYDGGQYFEKSNAFRRAEEIIEQGAHIIDVGGMSTRPGSKPVSPDEELNRIIPVIEHIAKNFKKIPISIDTYRSEVAKKAIDAGAVIINDISGLSADNKMMELVLQSKSSIIIMHMQGNPENMQENPAYSDVVDEVYDYLYERALKATQAGIEKEKIIVDPGIGFGKNVEHNLEILSGLSEFNEMGYPVLAGVSRKSFIGNLLGGLPAEERLEGSIAAAVYAFLNGAKILRVHDIKETLRALKIAKAIRDV